ncbi:TRAP transporter large permease [Brevibacillus marinus]|uniref:TRAP transporter large permease n=1 Tax=Brevibacillus marinus TaxID=2496837 RepID=UPI000F81E0A5|nr:TRAP transporter large permease [Brevibacillus marinus]
MTIAIPVLSLFAFLLIGVPVGFALALAGGLGLLLHGGWEAMAGILQTTPYASAASFVLTSVPMFILMAEFATNSGMSEKTFQACYKWLGHWPGGLALATVAASTGLAAIAGSSTAAAATMAKTAVGEMIKYNYRPSFAVGVVSIAGTLAIMIPPSIILIIYGILTEVPIGPLLIAGIIPGLLTAVGYFLSIVYWAKKRPEEAPRVAPFPLEERVRSIRGVWPMFLLIVFMVAAIYSGAVTPTEAGAVGAFAAMLLGFLLVGLNLSGMKQALSRTAETTCMIFVIIIGAMIFGYFVTATQITQSILSFIAELPVSPYVIMGIIVLIYLVLGTFMDQLAILFLTVPITFPISQALGFDPIWFGIIVTKTAEIGLVTPPLGMNVFIAANAAKVPIMEGFKGVSRLLVVELVILVILFFIPELSTWLPQQMGR